VVTINATRPIFRPSYARRGQIHATRDALLRYGSQTVVRATPSWCSGQLAPATGAVGIRKYPTLPAKSIRLTRRNMCFPLCLCSSTPAMGDTQSPLRLARRAAIPTMRCSPFLVLSPSTDDAKSARPVCCVLPVPPKTSPTLLMLRLHFRPFLGHGFGIIPAPGSLASSAFPVPPRESFGSLPECSRSPWEQYPLRPRVPQGNGAEKGESHHVSIC
jgi:hypothetical protein